MTEDDLSLIGDPESVVGELMEHDFITGILGATLVELESDYFEEKDWGSLPRLMACYRSLPPRDIADQITEKLGGSMVAIHVKEVGIPEETFSLGAPVPVVLGLYAEVLKENPKEAVRLLGLEDVSLMAWILLYEAFDPVHNFYRVIVALDQVGCRYCIKRQKDTNELTMFAVDEKVCQEWSKESIFESLVALMEATPETVAFG